MKPADETSTSHRHARQSDRGQPGWGFLLWPTLIGALIVTIIAALYNNVTRSTNDPKYW